nr:putative sulfate exporter family transporter [Sphingomonas quercus]
MVPGVGLCLAIAAAAVAVEAVERVLTGKAWLEGLVLAILIGVAVRSLWTPGRRWQPGIAFSGKYLLEVAVVLLGASVSTATILAVRPALLLGIVGVVGAAIPLAFGIGRMFGLPTRLALLVACGNAICGNSAIAAVAPVIGADGDDVAASIAFTAVLGIIVVLLLPLLGAAFGMNAIAAGTLAGLTVYAVPQVIAAVSPLGVVAVQIGTLVKLVRVLMLGPICLILSLIAPHLAPAGDARGEGRRADLAHLLPWFIIGFLALLGCRSLGLVPQAAIGPIREAATVLTIVSMAALGIGVDLGALARSGARVTMTVVLSLIVLGLLSLALIRLLGMA